ncbi:MAG: D-aminoacyl-tRNA deacylase [Candidatus Micrarchaeota archaeon]
MPTLLFSSRTEIIENFASYNVARELINFGFEQKTEIEWVYKKAKLIDAKFDRAFNVFTGDISVDYNTDYFVVLSPHRSEAKLKRLTTHIPGNWNNAEYGGKPRTLNVSYPSKQRAILCALFEKNKKYKLNFEVNYEVDHHGPTISKPIPIIFVELGSSENEWKNQLAARAIAEAVFEVINEHNNQSSGQRSEQCSERCTYFGIGGGHYAPQFTKYSLREGFCFGHMLPKYNIDTITEATFKQAIEKNIEKIDGILLDKNGVNKEQRNKIERLASDFGLFLCL